MDIEKIRDAIVGRRVRITDHADEAASEDGLVLDAIYASVQRGEVIEDYATDRPYPSCLVFGPTPDGDPVHSVWAYNKEKSWEFLITVYRPDPNRWVNWRQRKGTT